MVTIGDDGRFAFGFADTDFAGDDDGGIVLAAGCETGLAFEFWGPGRRVARMDALPRGGAFGSTLESTPAGAAEPDERAAWG